MTVRLRVVVTPGVEYVLPCASYATQLRQLIAEAVGEKLGIKVGPDDVRFQYDERVDEGVTGVTGVTIRSEVVETLPKPPVMRGGESCG